MILVLNSKVLDFVFPSFQNITTKDSANSWDQSLRHSLCSGIHKVPVIKRPNKNHKSHAKTPGI